jgi:prepilin-type N-terminal cleavage/methylation domain-containing protein/prepilin-type processing-associated H-X9-DG protein
MACTLDSAEVVSRKKVQNMCRPEHDKPSENLPRRHGFTLIELLVVVAIVAILLGLRLPVYASAKTKSKGAQCLNNVHQLSLAWLMCAGDNREYFLYSSDDGSGTAPYSTNNTRTAGDNFAWTWSKMDFAPSNPYNWDINADMALRPMWQYDKNASIYKCPGDTSAVISNGVALPRVRTYSMNFFLGGFGGDLSLQPVGGTWFNSFHPYTRLTDLADTVRSPGAANTFLFIEERQDCINWGNFITDMSGYPLTNRPAIPGLYRWNVDLPGAYHDRAGGISFCDGHAEIHKWVDGSTTPPIGLEFGKGSGTTLPVPYSVDVGWLQNASVRPH